MKAVVPIVFIKKSKIKEQICHSVIKTNFATQLFVYKKLKSHFMKSYNRTLLLLFITGFIAIFIGADQKLNGNLHFSYALWASMIVQIFSVICFVYWNATRLREMTRLF